MRALRAGMDASHGAVAEQFAVDEIDGLENPAIINTPGVVAADGLAVLQKMGRPADVLLETKAGMFAV